jgi:hypothetical protein
MRHGDSKNLNWGVRYNREKGRKKRYHCILKQATTLGSKIGDLGDFGTLGVE